MSTNLSPKLRNVVALCEHLGITDEVTVLLSTQAHAREMARQNQALRVQFLRANIQPVTLTEETGRHGPVSELEIANGAYLQYIETGDECYIANLTPDEMRAFIRDLGDTDRANNAARPGRG